MNLSDSLNDSDEQSGADLNDLDAEFDTNNHQLASDQMFFQHNRVGNINHQENFIQSEHLSNGTNQTAYKLDNFQNTALKNQSPNVGVHKSLRTESSFKLTYSSDKKSIDQSLKKNEERRRQISFGPTKLVQNYQNHNSVDQKLGYVDSLLNEDKFEQALNLLQQIENSPLQNNELIDMNYYYSRAFFAIERWDEFYYSAEQVLNLCLRPQSSKVQELLLTLPLLVSYSLRFDKFEDALKYQVMLVEIARGNGLNEIGQHVLLGQLYLKLSKYNEAYLVFKRAQDLEVDSEELKTLLINLYYIVVQLNRSEEIIEIANQLIELLPQENLIEIHLHLAKLYHQKQNTQLTINHQQEALKLQILINGHRNTDTCLIMFTLAKLQAESSLHQEAYQTYSQVAQLVGQINGTRNTLYAICLSSMGAQAHTLQDISQALQHQSEALEVYVALKGRVSESTIRVLINVIMLSAQLPNFDCNLIEEVFQSISQLDNGFIAAQLSNELGNILCSQGMLGQGIEAYISSIQRLSNQQENREQMYYILLNLGAAYIRSDDFQQSINCYNNALSIAMEFPQMNQAADVTRRIARAFITAGRVSEAKFHFDKAIKLLKQGRAHADLIMEFVKESRNIKI